MPSSPISEPKQAGDVDNKQNLNKNPLPAPIGSSSTSPSSLPDAPPAPTPIATTTAPVVNPKKRGVGITRDIPTPFVSLSKIPSASWFYMWGSSPQHPADYELIKDTIGEFVPMIWGAGSRTDTITQKQSNVQYSVNDALKYMNPNNKILLGFNEPDKTDQSNLTVEEVLTLWPILMQSGARLGSPAPASNPSRAGSWLMQFMQGVQARNLKVDFICAHYYLSILDNTTAAVEDLRRFLTNIYNTYQKPIWLTEFALMNFVWNSTTNQIDTFYPALDKQAEFAKEAAKMMDGLDIVERYAWYRLNQGTAVAPENYYLVDNLANITAVGVAYNSQ